MANQRIFVPSTPQISMTKGQKTEPPTLARSISRVPVVLS